MILARKKYQIKGSFLLFFLLVLVFWKFFSPGPKAANDFPYVFHEQLKEGFVLPSTWVTRGGDGMGEPAGLTMWAWPMDLLSGLGATLGLSFDIIERLFVLAILIIGIYSIKRLLKNYDLGEWPIFISTLLYLTTTYL